MANIPEFLKARPLHEALKPLSWIIGSWTSKSAHGQYPTISPFTYCEQISFRSFGQPLLQFGSVTWHPEKENAMHMESGFLRIKPGTNQVSFMVAHNFGVTTLEEGFVNDESITLETSHVARMSFAQGTKVVKRKFNLKGDELEQVVHMETDKTPLTEHLKILYQRVE